LKYIQSHANSFFFYSGSNAWLGDKIHTQIVILNKLEKTAKKDIWMQYG
jgi:hypothetical protein